MLAFFANHPLLSAIIAIVALIAGVIFYQELKDKLAARRDLDDIKDQAYRFGGHWPGGTTIKIGDNWQLICPDCGTYNVMYRPAGVACRHCRNELLIVPPEGGSQGGTAETLGVISRVTGASNNRVAWTALSANAPRVHPARIPWAPAVFQDVQSVHALELNPPTDLDWETVHHYMPIVCPSCKGGVMADCEDCRRTGIRFIPLESWRKDGVSRASQSGINYQRLTYSGRCGVTSQQGIDMFNGLYLSGRGGWGPLVMEGRRKERPPMPDEMADIERARGSDLPQPKYPVQPEPRSVRDGGQVERPIAGYQPKPDAYGRGPNNPPRKP